LLPPFAAAKPFGLPGDTLLLTALSLPENPRTCPQDLSPDQSRCRLKPIATDDFHGACRSAQTPRRTFRDPSPRLEEGHPAALQPVDARARRRRRTARRESVPAAQTVAAMLVGIAASALVNLRARRTAPRPPHPPITLGRHGRARDVRMPRATTSARHPPDCPRCPRSTPPGGAPTVRRVATRPSARPG
jgi:hypothetical protein